MGRQRQTIELRLTLFTAPIFSHHQPKMGLGGFVIALLLTTLLTFGATAEELAFKPSDFPDVPPASWHGGDSTKHCFRRWTLIFVPLLTILLYDFLCFKLLFHFKRLLYLHLHLHSLLYFMTSFDSNCYCISRGYCTCTIHLHLHCLTFFVPNFCSIPIKRLLYWEQNPSGATVLLQPPVQVKQLLLSLLVDFYYWGVGGWGVNHAFWKAFHYDLGPTNLLYN